MRPCSRSFESVKGEEPNIRFRSRHQVAAHSAGYQLPPFEVGRRSRNAAPRIYG